MSEFYEPLCENAWAIPPSPLMIEHSNTYHTCSECGEPVEKPIQPEMYDSFSSDQAANLTKEGINKKLGLPFGDGMEKVAICFDVDGTLIEGNDVEHEQTIVLLEMFMRQEWKNLDIIVWSGGGAEYAETIVRRLFPYSRRFLKFHSKLEHNELRKKYSKIIAIDDVQDTRLGDVNLIVRNI
jgi:hypothetical protein